MPDTNTTPTLSNDLSLGRDFLSNKITESPQKTENRGVLMNQQSIDPGYLLSDAEVKGLKTAADVCDQTLLADSGTGGNWNELQHVAEM